MEIGILLSFTLLYTVFDAESIYVVENVPTDWLTAKEKCSDGGIGNLHFINSNDEIKELSKCNIQNRTWVGNLRLVTPYLRFLGCFNESLAKGHCFDFPSGATVSRCYMKCNKTLPIGIQDYRCVCFDFPGWIRSEDRTHFCKTCSHAQNEICGCKQMLAVYDRGDLNDGTVETGNGFCVISSKTQTTTYRRKQCREINFGICENGIKIENKSWIATSVSCMENKSLLARNVPSDHYGDFFLNTRQYSHIINSKDLQYVQGLRCDESTNEESKIKCLCGYLTSGNEMKVSYTRFCKGSNLFEFSFLCSKNVSDGSLQRQCSVNTSKTSHQYRKEFNSFHWNGCLEETTQDPFSTVIRTDEYKQAESTSRLNDRVLSTKRQSPEHSLKTDENISSFETNTFAKLSTRSSMHFTQKKVNSKEYDKDLIVTSGTSKSVSSSKAKNSVMTGVIVGSVIGSVAILSLLASIIIWKWRISAKSKRDNSSGVAKANVTSKAGGLSVELNVNISAETNNAPLYAVVSKPKSQNVGINDKSGNDETKARGATGITDEYYVSSDGEYDRLGTNRKHNRTTSSDNEYNIADARTFDNNIYCLAKSIDADGHVDGTYDVALNVRAEMESAPGGDTYDHSSPL